ncbi:CARDB domain-containing protein [Nocardioides sp.]|uniref:CARDB domain-containing protein n=1 Tax=Nocardioides sp. TaxID=35761 RepID=UPI002609BADA|nr:CARDB domain-containing protein [Nocardioides sp.]
MRQWLVALLVTLLVALLGLASVGLLPSPSYAATARPDLTVPALTGPTTAHPGSPLTLTVTVRNGGTAPARRSRLTLTVGRTTVSATVPRLRAHRSVRVRLRLRAPAVGRYRVRACADAALKVRERRESNNCRVSSLAVTARTPQTKPPVTPTPPAGLLATPAPMSVDVVTDATPPVTAIATPDTSVTIPPLPAGTASVGFTVPGRAVVDRVRLQARPVTLPHHPFTTLLGAALVTPDVLTADSFDAQFVLPTSPDVGSLVAFTADAGGTDLRLAPLDIGRFPFRKRVFVRMLHGGIVGLATATPAQIAAVAKAWPSEADQQVEAALALRLLDVWRATWSDTDVAAPRAAFSATARSAAATAVSPALAAVTPTTPYAAVVGADRLAQGWRTLVSDAYADDSAAIPADLAEPSAALANAQGAVIRGLAPRAQDGSCGGGAPGPAQIRFVMGTARALLHQGDTTLADQVLHGSGLGETCSYLLTQVTQEWSIRTTGTSPGEESGRLQSSPVPGTWSSSGWAMPSTGLSWTAYAASGLSQACQSGSYETGYGPGAGSTVGVRFGSYGLTPLRGGGFTPPTALVRLYAGLDDPGGTTTLPTRTVTHTGGCDGLPDTSSTEPITAPPLDDPEATAPADRASQGWGGEFTLSGGYAMSHDVTLTGSTPVSGGTREVTQRFSILIQPT